MVSSTEFGLNIILCCTNVKQRKKERKVEIDIANQIEIYKKNLSSFTNVLRYHQVIETGNDVAEFGNVAN